MQKTILTNKQALQYLKQFAPGSNKLLLSIDSDAARVFDVAAQLKNEFKRDFVSVAESPGGTLVEIREAIPEGWKPTEDEISAVYALPAMQAGETLFFRSNRAGVKYIRETAERLNPGFVVTSKRGGCSVYIVYIPETLQSLKTRLFARLDKSKGFNFGFEFNPKQLDVIRIYVSSYNKRNGRSFRVFATGENYVTIREEIKIDLSGFDRIARALLETGSSFTTLSNRVREISVLLAAESDRVARIDVAGEKLAANTDGGLIVDISRPAAADVPAPKPEPDNDLNI